MNYYYITGTSKGIGKAFAEYLLNDPTNQVIGLSRKRTIKHSNYRHFYIDLSNPASVSDFKFELHARVEKIYLINNAGSLGDIKTVGKLKATEIIKNYNLNLIAPAILTNAFIKCYTTTDAEKVIVNMSSGAAKNPIDGWSVYCSSKAALDMFSKVVDAEQKVKANRPIENIHNRFLIFSIAPGVVDTNMQDKIRSASEGEFSRLNDFVGYKENNQLAKPGAIAEKYFKLLSNLSVIKEVSSSIKDYE